jgi:predicted Na+-dependent transporter
MWTRLKNSVQHILQPPVFEGDEEKTTKAQLLYTFLAIAILTALVFPFASRLGGNPVSPLVIRLVLILLGSALGLVFLVRAGFVVESGIVLTLVIWGVFAFGAYWFGGLHDTAIIGFLLVIVLASLVGGWRTLVAFSGLAIAALFGLYYMEHTALITPTVTIPSDGVDLALPVAEAETPRP